MINFLIEFTLISALVCWLIFWIHIIGLERELNTYYYIPSVGNAYIEIYMKDWFLIILMLFAPIVNIIFIIRCLLEDHLALLNDFADSVGAVPIEFNDDDDDNN